jgi:hypothetical protein
MKRGFEVGAALLAFSAAIFWFLSAYGEVPQMQGYWGTVPPTDPFYAAMRFSAYMNTWASVLSGLSAACLGVSAFIRRP